MRFPSSVQVFTSYAEEVSVRFWVVRRERKIRLLLYWFVFWLLYNTVLLTWAAFHVLWLVPVCVLNTVLILYLLGKWAKLG